MNRTQPAQARGKSSSVELHFFAVSSRTCSRARPLPPTVMAAVHNRTSCVEFGMSVALVAAAGVECEPSSAGGTVAPSRTPPNIRGRSRSIEDLGDLADSKNAGGFHTIFRYTAFRLLRGRRLSHGLTAASRQKQENGERRSTRISGGERDCVLTLCSSGIKLVLHKL